MEFAVLERAGFFVDEMENGWCVIRTSVRVGQEIWARLAHLQYRDRPEVRDLLRPDGGYNPPDTIERVARWAAHVMESAEWNEGSNAPISFLESHGWDSITLSWKGSWTPGREVHVQFFRDEAYVRFNTGTGKASSFLECIFIDAMHADTVSQ